VKTLSGKATQKVLLNGNDGKPSKSQEEEKQTKEHFSAVPNCPEPSITHDFDTEPVNTLDINDEEFTAAEITRAHS